MTASELGPALDLPAGQVAFATQMEAHRTRLLLVDLPLVVLVAVASYALALVAVRPLLTARERERRFAADAAHELRTPLAAIATLAQAAAPDAPAHERSVFERIATRALDASRLVGDLLALTRGDAGSRSEFEPVDLAAVAARSVREAAPNARADVRIETALESAIIEGDEPRLRQLAQNLLENATRHAKSRVRIETRVEGDLALFTIEDDGAGVAPEHRERIFERFYRGGETGGTGLGLAISRWVATTHHGTLDLEGANRFVARFPLHPDAR